MAAVYVLARDVAGAPAGVVSALVFGTAPFVAFSALRFQLDLPLASMVALTLLVLTRVVAFEHRGWSVVAGLALGLGMLTKPPFAAYVLAPLVLTAARIRSRRAVANLALAWLIGGALSLPWYGPRLLGLLPEVASRGFRQAAESGHPDPLTATALTLYPRWFPTQFGLVAVVLFVLGLGVAAWRRHWLLLAAVVSHAETPRSRAFATSRSESTTSASTRSARPRKAGSIRSTPNECESSGRRSSPPTSARSSASSRASRA